MTSDFARLLAGAALAVAIFPAAAEEQDAIGRFDITAFQVTGNTILAQQTIDSILAPYVGVRRNFGDVQQALEALEGVYHKRGFNVVQVALPEQELDRGVVTLQVIETKLAKVTVEGNTVFDEANIRRSLPGLRTGQTPNLGEVSSSLRLANENPAKKTTLQLQSGDKDGEVNALVKVADDKPWRLAATLDNTGNESTGKTQVTSQFQYANLFGRDQVLSLQYTTTLEKPSQVSVYGAGYHVPLYGLGDSIDLFASYSDVDSGSVLAGIFNLQVSGRGTVVGGRYNQNVRRRGDYESKIVYGLDHKAFQNNINLLGSQLGNDVTVHPLSVTYSGTLTGGADDISFGLTAMHNIPGGDKGSRADFERVRTGADAAYKLLRYNLGYNRLLPADWQLRLVASGQYSNDALVPGEQFGAGGASSVRGFGERDVSGDKGHLASAEIYTPNLCGLMDNLAAQCRVLAFYDAASISRNRALPGEVVRSSIGSAGVGMRVGLGKHLNMQVDYGRVLNGGATQEKGDKRLHFRLGLTY